MRGAVEGVKVAVYFRIILLIFSYSINRILEYIQAVINRWKRVVRKRTVAIWIPPVNGLSVSPYPLLDQDK